MNKIPLLLVTGLEIAFKKEGHFQTVIKNISYTLGHNEILGIVGEFGSGKSVSSLAIMGLLPVGISKITHGEIVFDGKNIERLPPKKLRYLRGNEIAMIFQEPMSSLNPSLKCGYQVQEILLQHTSMSKAAAKVETLALFTKVKLPDPQLIFNKYPHEISGGQKQRVTDRNGTLV